jgi:hypothetical protein
MTIKKRKKEMLILGVPVLGSIDDLFAQNIERKNFAIAIGNNKIRRNILEKIRQKGGNLLL